MEADPNEPQTEELDESLLPLFGGLLDYMESEKVDSLKKQAPKRDIRLLIKFLGGFEHWNLLNEDCRREVVKYLEFADRKKLGHCSKRDYETVKTTPVDVCCINIHDNEKTQLAFSQEEFDNVVVHIQLDDNVYSRENIYRVFSQFGEDTEVRWKQSKAGARPVNKRVVWESCNYYEEAVKFAEKWMKKCNFELKQLKISMSRYPFETSTIKSFPKCEAIEVKSDDVELFRWWLQKVPVTMRNIELSPLHEDEGAVTIPSELLDAPQVMETLRFHSWCHAAFTDEQFLKLKGNQISFMKPNVTDAGINQFLKNWVNRNVFDFKEVLLFTTKDRNISEMTRGLDVRPWDDEFRSEAGFCDDFEWVCDSGTCVQIPNRFDPYESLTLCVSEDRVSIYATGHRSVRDGKPYTEYSVL